jgi:adenylate cyclase
MGTEVERKFLVRGDAWKRLGTPERYRQGYLSTDPQRVVRVRVAGDRGLLTVKSEVIGITRSEFEYEIPIADASAMLDALCHKPLIEKTRWRVDHAGHVWEVDEFAGENQGLVVAEVELASEDAVPELPSWVGAEVTGIVRYYNSALAQRPYRAWSADERDG